jgi:NCS1 family nucleobase:cation symporter-1
MVLNGHAGTKYGIPFPVFAAGSFGTSGTQHCVRAARHRGVRLVRHPDLDWGICHLQNRAAAVAGPGIPVIGFFSNENIGQRGPVCLFPVLLAHQHAGDFRRGMESIRMVENWGAPLLILMGLALLGWAWARADGFGPMLSQPDRLETGHEGQFWKVFFPGLTAMVGFWATLSLNIPDFTREARSQQATR